MSIAFWSAKVSGKNSVVVQPPEGFVLNVTQLALTDAKAGKGSQVVKVKTVSVEGDELESVIATLRSPGVEQCSVSLVFGYDVPTEFSTSGDANGTVYLSGYYQPGTDEDEDDPYGGAYGEDEEDEEDEEDGDSDDSDEEDSQDEGGDEEECSVEDGSDEDDMDEEEKIRGAEAAIAKLGAARKDALIVDGKAASSKLTAKGKTATAAKKTESSDDDDDDDDDDDESSDDDSEEERIDTAFVEKMIRRNQLSASSDGGDDSSSSDEEEEPPLKLAKGTAPKGIVTASGQKQKQRQQQQQQQHSTPNGAKTAPPNTPATAAKSKTPGTGAGAAAGNSKKTPQGMQAQHSNKGKGHQSGNKRKH